MKRLFEQMFQRPLNAFVSSAELLNRSISGSQRIDGIVSRMVHTLSSSHVNSGVTQQVPSSQSRCSSWQDCMHVTGSTRKEST